MAEKYKKEEKRKSEGVANSVLHGLGKIIPGLGGLFEGLEKSDAFKERLSIINKEVERQLKEAPLKKVGRTIIPPKTTFRSRTLKKEEPAVQKPKEMLVDIFDEKEYIRIIAELPGVEEKDIKTKLERDLLTISAEGTFKKYHKEITLPCLVNDKMGLTYKNGILQIRLEKK